MTAIEYDNRCYNSGRKRMPLKTHKPPKAKHPKLDRIRMECLCFKIDRSVLLQIDALIEEELYHSRADFYREAIRMNIIRNPQGRLPLKSVFENTLQPKEAKLSVSFRMPEKIVNYIKSNSQEGGRSEWLREIIVRHLDRVVPTFEVLKNE